MEQHRSFETARGGCSDEGNRKKVVESMRAQFISPYTRDSSFEVKKSRVRAFDSEKLNFNRENIRGLCKCFVFNEPASELLAISTFNCSLRAKIGHALELKMSYMVRIDWNVCQRIRP